MPTGRACDALPGMKRVLLLAGTRPEVIKMAPVAWELRRRSEDFQTIVCLTGQHEELVAPLIRELDFAPDHRLAAMRPGRSLAALVAALLDAIDALVDDTGPDWILAQGDTASVLAASTCAFLRGIPFGHVEAGLRTGDLGHPFPEEYNRRVADIGAAAFFAPTEGARVALLREGAPEDRILVTGNTGIDTLLHVAGRPAPRDLDLGDGPLVLVTAHRRENFGEPMERICAAIRAIADEHPHASVLVPLHANPVVRAAVQDRLEGIRNVRLAEALPYPAMVHAMKGAALILSDSGGIQEEAPTFRTPLLVLREKTERPEAVEGGFAKLVGSDPDRIVAEARAVLAQPGVPPAWYGDGANPFGDGHAARRIADHLAAAG